MAQPISAEAGTPGQDQGARTKEPAPAEVPDGHLEVLIKKYILQQRECCYVSPRYAQYNTH